MLSRTPWNAIAHPKGCEYPWLGNPIPESRLFFLDISEKLQWAWFVTIIVIYLKVLTYLAFNILFGYSIYNLHVRKDWARHPKHGNLETVSSIHNATHNTRKIVRH